MYLAALLPRDARRDPNAISAEQAVEMATIGGAKALRLDDSVGSIEIGKEADMVIFDTDDFDWQPLFNPIANLVYGATGHTVDTVIVGGDLLVEGKRLVHIDEAKVRQDAETVTASHLRRDGRNARPGLAGFCNR